MFRQFCVFPNNLHADSFSNRKGVAGIESPRDELRASEESAFCAALRNKRNRFKKEWDLPSQLGLLPSRVWHGEARVHPHWVS
jgi:hypothetical protein